jgi:hypothetical protein
MVEILSGGWGIANIAVHFDVITSLVSLVYWGFRCEKVTSQGESYSNVA